MDFAGGIGIAAPQVGLPLQICIVAVAACLESDEKSSAEINGNNPSPDCHLILCNPTITEVSDETSIEQEGCLSVPGRHLSVRRPRQIVVEFFDLQGRRNRLVASGLPARCCQHEIDHLHGILFIDRAIRPE
jgi:peptide deformylase